MSDATPDTASIPQENKDPANHGYRVGDRSHDVQWYTKESEMLPLSAATQELFEKYSGLAPEDFTQLPPYGIYASLLSRGRQTGWFSGRTLPPSAAISSPEAVIRESLARYGETPQDPAPGTHDPAASPLFSKGFFVG